MFLHLMIVVAHIVKAHTTIFHNQGIHIACMTPFSLSPLTIAMDDNSLMLMMNFIWFCSLKTFLGYAGGGPLSFFTFVLLLLP